MHANITNGTWGRHIQWVCICCWHAYLDMKLMGMSLRIIKAYITYHLHCNSQWLPHIVSHETPKHICEFITHKCGPKEKGFEGQKVCVTPWLHSMIYNSCSISIQQPSQHRWHSHSGTDLSDLTKVFASGAMILRMVSGLCHMLSLTCIRLTGCSH
jgi:hypothetical protein